MRWLLTIEKKGKPRFERLVHEAPWPQVVLELQALVEAGVFDRFCFEEVAA